MNATKTEYVFVDALDNLLVDCRSGDPTRAINCKINTALGAITGIILPVFIVTGLFFNSLVAYIYLFRETVWTRQNVYLGVMAIADNCNIFINGFLWLFLAKGLPWLSDGRVGYFHVNSSSLACSVIRYFEQLCHMTSGALFLLFVVDRTLSVYFPFKLRSLSGKSALIASLTVIAVCMLINIPKGLGYKWAYGDGTIVCNLDYGNLPRVIKDFLFYYNIFFFFPPVLFLALTLLANILLVIKVKLIISDRKKLTGGTNAEQQSSIRNSVICVLLSVLWLLFSLPGLFGVILEDLILRVNPNAGAEIGGTALAWGLYDIGIASVNINQAINWLVLVWRSENFRKELLSVLRCR